MRYSLDVGQTYNGVPQGNPLSMQLFMMAINPIIEKLENKYNVISYADDILIGADMNLDPNNIISEVSDLLKTIGLKINLLKCKSTKNDEVKFM